MTRAIMVCLGLAFAGAALAQASGPGAVATTSKGRVLVDAKGMTLYTFDRDAPGRSLCSGQCIANWPPYPAAAAAAASGDWTVISRDDGSRQWAYKGKALYTWAKDAKAGDVTGDKVNNVWQLARP